MNVKNIQRAIDHIKMLKSENFDMNVLRANVNDWESPECGSVGCIVGHCTILDAENIKENFINDYGEILFMLWSVDFFGVELNSNEWEYMFSGIWGRHKNTNGIGHAMYRMQRIVDGYKPEDINIEIEKK